MRMFLQVLAMHATRSLLVEICNINLQALTSGESGIFPSHEKRILFVSGNSIKQIN